MNLAVDSEGEILSGPEDTFVDYGIPIQEWLSKVRSSDDSYSEGSKAEDTAARCRKYLEACRLVNEVGGSFDDLRHVPRVIENYYPNEENIGDGHGLVQLIFIFKYDNNGTTFRVIDAKHFA